MSHLSYSCSLAKYGENSINICKKRNNDQYVKKKKMNEILTYIFDMLYNANYVNVNPTKKNITFIFELITTTYG